MKRNILRVLCFGWRYYCPLCRSHVRLLKPTGFDFPVIREKQIIGGGLRNALCPVCGSSDRVRLLYLFLKNKTNLFNSPARLLHVAPEKPLMDILQKQKNIDYLTADLNPENVMIKIDITQIPFPDASFDAILCNHVLEHIPDDRKAMRELRRVLKPGGWAVLQVPVSALPESTYEDPTVILPEERESVFGQRDHVRIYGNDYTQRLMEAGFQVEEWKWILDTDMKVIASRYGLNREESVFFCKTSLK